jgi:hypothetical protein
MFNQRIRRRQQYQSWGLAQLRVLVVQHVYHVSVTLVRLSDIESPSTKPEILHVAIWLAASKLKSNASELCRLKWSF